MPILALAPHPFAKINKFIFQLFKQLFRNRNLVMFFISIKRITGNNTIVNICIRTVFCYFKPFNILVFSLIKRKLTAKPSKTENTNSINISFNFIAISEVYSSGLRKSLIITEDNSRYRQLHRHDSKHAVHGD